MLVEVEVVALFYCTADHSGLPSWPNNHMQSFPPRLGLENSMHKLVSLAKRSSNFPSCQCPFSSQIDKIDLNDLAGPCCISRNLRSSSRMFPVTRFDRIWLIACTCRFYRNKSFRAKPNRGKIKLKAEPYPVLALVWLSHN